MGLLAAALVACGPVATPPPRDAANLDGTAAASDARNDAAAPIDGDSRDVTTADTVTDAADVRAITGPRVAYASRQDGRFQLRVVATDGTGEQQLTFDASDHLYPAWSPDGARIVFARSNAVGLFELWSLDVARGAATPLATGAQNATLPAFSPDGATIAFEGRAAGATSADIYIVPAAGGAATQLTTDPGHDTGPFWSPDGRTLYFVSDRGGTYEVYAMSPSGGAPHAITTGLDVLGRPAVAPDGATLAIARTPSGSRSVLFAYALATGATRMLAADGSEPAYSPDGARLAMGSGQFGTPDLVLIDAADGAHAQRLTDDPAIDSGPAFAPVLH